MAYINIAFDSRQVAGWEQMLGGRPEGERLSERETENYYKVLFYKHKLHVITGVSQNLQFKCLSAVSKQSVNL